MLCRLSLSREHIINENGCFAGFYNVPVMNSVRVTSSKSTFITFPRPLILQEKNCKIVDYNNKFSLSIYFNTINTLSSTLTAFLQ
jgi:hypothetical protein